MTKQEATDAAIELIKGKELAPGSMVAVKYHPLAMELVRYEGDTAVCNDGKGDKPYPKCDLFDIRQCINVANHLLNVGFWREDMESSIVAV